MKYLKYDEISGNITDEKGALVCTMAGYTGIDIEQHSPAENTLQLVKQGVTVDEIIKLKNADLI